MAPAEPEEPVVEAPARPRFVGVFTSAPTLATGLDLDAHGFYGSASMALAPLAFSRKLWMFGLDAGWSRHFASDSRWSFDLFVMATPGIFPDSCDDCRDTTQYFLAAGLGAGVHATFDNGFSLSFKMPLLGYAYSSSDSWGNRPSEMFGLFYLLSAASQPFAAFGYRW
jgi:hypothetical protein